MDKGKVYYSLDLLAISGDKELKIGDIQEKYEILFGIYNLNNNNQILQKIKEAKDYLIQNIDDVNKIILANNNYKDDFLNKINIHINDLEFLQENVDNDFKFAFDQQKNKLKSVQNRDEMNDFSIEYDKFYNDFKSNNLNNLITSKKRLMINSIKQNVNPFLNSDKAIIKVKTKNEILEKENYLRVKIKEANSVKELMTLNKLLNRFINDLKSIPINQNENINNIEVSDLPPKNIVTNESKKGIGYKLLIMFSSIIILSMLFIIIYSVLRKDENDDNNILYDGKTYTLYLDYGPGMPFIAGSKETTYEIQIKSGKTYTLPKAKRDGYQFGGWSYELNSSDTIELFVMPNKNVELYAYYYLSEDYLLNVNVFEQVEVIEQYGSFIKTSDLNYYQVIEGELFSITEEKYENDKYLMYYYSKFNSYLNHNEIVLKHSTSGIYGHSIALTSEGRVLAVGDNNYGQLGDGTTFSKDFPVDITDNIGLNPNETVKDVKTGTTHTLIITSEKRVLTFGNNNLYQLGDRYSIYKSTPLDITNNIPIYDNVNDIFYEVHNNTTIIITDLGGIFNIGDILGNQKNYEYNPTPVFDFSSSLQYGERIINIDFNDITSFIFVTNYGRTLLWSINESNDQFIYDISNVIDLWS